MGGGGLWVTTPGVQGDVNSPSVPLEQTLGPSWRQASSGLALPLLDGGPHASLTRVQRVWRQSLSRPTLGVLHADPAPERLQVFLSPFGGGLVGTGGRLALLAPAFGSGKLR